MQKRSAAAHAAPETTARGNIERALRSVRNHLGMDVAFISEFVGHSRVFRHVDSGARKAPIGVGEWVSLKDGYCKKVIDGNLPELIPDTARLPAAMAIPATQEIPVGAHLGVPLRLSDGQLYGTFCCFSYNANASLDERDLRTMRAFADLVAHQIDAEMSETRARAHIFDRIEAALDSGEPSIVYQPSYCLLDERLLGAESLSRFAPVPARTPDVWFADADRVGLKTDLELKAIRNAIDGFAPAWQAGKYYLGLNSSPQTILDSRLADVIRQAPADCIMLEITEHDHVDNYADLLKALEPLRASGVKVAVDDAGSGYASMRHIINIRPDVIKLDVSLTRGIESDRTRLALARALCEFGRQTGSSIVAEGIETAAELETLRGIGVHGAQGYFLGKPMPFRDFGRLMPVSAVA